MSLHLPPAARHWRALFALAISSSVVIGCGVGSGGTGSGGTESPLSFSQGPISGFGSIVVNGVHFDDSTASVVDDDGNALSNTANLHLGTVVDVQGGVVVSGATAATAIHVHVDIVGPVTSAFDPATNRLEVLGQPVRIIATTALDDFAGGATTIAAGSVVAVSSLYDKATGVYVATRMAPEPAAAHFSIRGALQAVDTVGKTFMIGADTFDYGSLVLPTPFAAGQLVRVVLRTTPAGTGHWVVTAFGQALPALEDGRSGGLKGVVGSQTDATHFVVAGVSIDASAARFTPAGASVAVQSRVEVHGTVVDGVLVATQVQLDARDDGHNDDGGGSGGDDSFQITGAILGAVDTVHQTFTMRGPTTVNYASASFSSGSAADLAAGRVVEVKGNLSTDGTQVIATQVKIDH